MGRHWRPGKRVAIVGAGPGGVSAALGLLQRGFDVQLFERQAEPKPLGGAVLLSVPVLAVLRSYGIDSATFGAFTRTEFRNAAGKLRVDVPFNAEVERAMGIPGWHYGVLRSTAFRHMLDRLPEGVVQPGQSFESYAETPSGIEIRFASGLRVKADILIGADGIRSGVSAQAFGAPDLFHVGLRVWLAWCGEVPGLPRDRGVLHHGRRVQASYFPMLHEGKPGFEWWVVEPSSADAVPPEDVEAHLRGLLKGFADPMPRFADHTDFSRQIFRWEIYNRPSLKHWTKGRVACLGDAVHPVSPYAAYGMGMAIEDGYVLARALEGRSLSDGPAVADAFARYEAERVAYVNHNVEFARMLGQRFHNAPAPVAWLRDMVFDHTSVLQRLVEKDYLAAAEAMSLQLRELHVDAQGRAPAALPIEPDQGASTD
ncbi:NAD(P)/FAD-dependent oxidoreductase [Pararhodobacter sp. CCB-MM2]|uniref:FAD-dependent oxidoreductase n=1 Tax=Pararhodobacter sp. CCB-MM2 TaxID=1786003 RepID=UPI000AFDC7A1|nr:NAD(P)/FAD-dependent oxidoreductase [Pararhodobacter sp. CCB-MM2]